VVVNVGASGGGKNRTQVTIQLHTLITISGWDDIVVIKETMFDRFDLLHGCGSNKQQRLL